MVEECIAINSGNTEKILDLLNEYYKQYNLTLVEEKIGSRRSKYTTGPKKYNNHDEYFADNDSSDATDGMATNFYVITDIVSAPNWCVMIFQEHLAIYTLAADNRLTEFLSKELETSAFIYNGSDSVGGYFEFGLWQDGELKDYIEIMIEMVASIIMISGQPRTYGVFTFLNQEIKGLIEEDKRTKGHIKEERIKKLYEHIYEERDKVLDKYGYGCGFDFKRGEADFKAFYLQGHPDDIRKCLL